MIYTTGVLQSWGNLWWCHPRFSEWAETIFHQSPPLFFRVRTTTIHFNIPMAAFELTGCWILIGTFSSWFFLLWVETILLVCEQVSWLGLRCMQEYEKNQKDLSFGILQFCIESFFKYMNTHLSKWIYSALWCFAVSLAPCSNYYHIRTGFLLKSEVSFFIHLNIIFFVLCSEKQAGNQYLERVI